MSERLPKQVLGPQDNVTHAIGLHAAAGNDDAVRVADAARPRGPEVGDAEREAPLRSGVVADPEVHDVDRKSTRLNSSHSQISYAVFCLKKKRNISGCRLRC